MHIFGSAVISLSEHVHNQMRESQTPHISSSKFDLIIFCCAGRIFAAVAQMRCTPRMRQQFAVLVDVCCCCCCCCYFFLVFHCIRCAVSHERASVDRTRHPRTLARSISKRLRFIIHLIQCIRCNLDLYASL